MRIPKGRMRRLTEGGAFLLCIVGAWTAGLAFHHGGGVERLAAEEEGSRYVPNSRLATGQELLMVFITASSCGASRDTELPALLERAKLLARASVKEEDESFRAVAVALDWDVATGYAFLERFGQFDQVSVGANWMNEGSIKYIWRDVPGHATMPQVLLLSRNVVADSSGIHVGPERLLRRLVGTEEIRRWVESGATAPVGEAAARTGT